MDGHTLQIEKLKGTKPAEKINLPHKNLGVASAIIIASCIKGNGALKELECATAPEHLLSCQGPLTLLSTCFLTRTRRLGDNKLGAGGVAALAEGLKGGNSTLQVLE